MSNLNEQQREFCEQYIANEYNGTAAYLNAYEQKDKKSAAVGASQLLRNPAIIEQIKNVEGDYRILGHKLGIDKKLILKTLLGLLSAKKQVFYNGEGVGEVDDNPSINKATETLLKIMGDFAAEKSEVVIDEGSIDFSKMTEEEKKEYKEKLIREL